MPACRFAAAVLIPFLLVACSGRPDRPAAPRPVYSPVGEYLALPRGARCEDALQRWFDRADANHDGRFDAAERQAEAVRLFAAFDADADGFVTPQELLASRRSDPPVQETAPARRRGRNVDTSPDPVMAADLNLDFRVSRSEFDQHVERRLQAADADRRGYLVKADLPALCVDSRH